MNKAKCIFRPSIICPAGSMHTLEGTIEDGVLWVDRPNDEQCPAGRFGVHLASRIVIIPAEAEAPKAKAPAKAKAQVAA